MNRALSFGAWTVAPNALSAALVFAVGGKAACPRTSLQPPGWVFGAVWPALYVALGVAMAILAGERSAVLISVAALVVALNAWWLAFGTKCRPVAALAAICALTVAAAAVAVKAYRANATAGALVAPLVAWLAFATVLSVQQVLFMQRPASPRTPACPAARAPPGASPRRAS
jgi:tryptophan-rich sensory protein